MLKKNFYVDNLIKTSNSVEMLSELYTTANYRMEKGHFNLRSWNMNCEELKTLMIKDQKFLEHGCQLEKVLGYKIFHTRRHIRFQGHLLTSLLTLKVANWPKRQGFSTLYLCLPVTIRGKMLERFVVSKIRLR